MIESRTACAWMAVLGVALVSCAIGCGGEGPDASTEGTDTAAAPTDAATDDVSTHTADSDRGPMPDLPEADCLPIPPMDYGGHGWGSYRGYTLLQDGVFVFEGVGGPYADLTGDGRADRAASLFAPMGLPGGLPDYAQGLLIVRGRASFGDIHLDELLEEEGDVFIAGRTADASMSAAVLTAMDASDDWDLDGNMDLLVSVQTQGAGIEPTTDWYVLWGPLVGPSISPADAALDGRASKFEDVPERFRGGPVSIAPSRGVGDVTGDGFPDFGGSMWGDGAPGNAALVIPGTGSRTLPSVQTTLDGVNGMLLWGSENAAAGAAQRVGDFDGDGLADVGVKVEASPFFRPVTIVYGDDASVEADLESLPSSGALVVEEDHPSFSAFGDRGDVNGDGHDDYFASGGFLLFGGPRRTGSLSPGDIVGTGAGVKFEGFGVAGAVEDVDGDGFDDMLAGAPNHIQWIIYGGRDLPAVITLEDLHCHRVRATLLGSPFEDANGNAAPILGAVRLADFNGDRHADVLTRGRHTYADGTWTDALHTIFAP